MKKGESPGVGVLPSPTHIRSAFSSIYDIMFLHSSQGQCVHGGENTSGNARLRSVMSHNNVFHG